MVVKEEGLSDVGPPAGPSVLPMYSYLRQCPATRKHSIFYQTPIVSSSRRITVRQAAISITVSPIQSSTCSAVTKSYTRPLWRHPNHNVLPTHELSPPLAPDVYATSLHTHLAQSHAWYNDRSRLRCITVRVSVASVPLALRRQPLLHLSKPGIQAVSAGRSGTDCQRWTIERESCETD